MTPGAGDHEIQTLKFVGNSGFIVDRVEFLSLTPFVSPAAQGARPYAYDQQRAKSEEAAARAAGAGERKGKGKGGATE